VGIQVTAITGKPAICTDVLMAHNEYENGLAAADV
jgi:hypothetical protein